MNSSPTPDTQAILLLCAKLGEHDEVAKPLTARQYAALGRWLEEHSLRPADLLGNDGRSSLSELSLREVAQDQVDRLLDRGAALGMIVERWTSRGLWILSVADDEYPSRYRTYLQHVAPPILFGVGERETLDKGGLAIVGSRHASEEDIAFAQNLGTTCAAQRIAVISGAAKGIDSGSMMAAINSGGKAIGVLAEGLGRTAVAGSYQESILEGRLTLISPYEPESRWQPYTAMDRNKLIYALSDAALVVASSDEHGGTWSGAAEALKKGQIPIYVRASGKIPAGNRKLIQSGALEFPEPCDDFTQLFAKDHSAGPLFSQAVGPGAELVHRVVEEPSEILSERPESERATSSVGEAVTKSDDDSLLIEAIIDALAEPLNLRTLAIRLRLTQGRTKVLAKRAAEEGRIQKIRGLYARATTLPTLFGDHPDPSTIKRS